MSRAPLARLFISMQENYVGFFIHSFPEHMLPEYNFPSYSEIDFVLAVE